MTQDEKVKLIDSLCEGYEVRHPKGDDHDGAAEMLRLIRGVAAEKVVFLAVGSPASEVLRGFPEGSPIWGLVRVMDPD